MNKSDLKLLFIVLILCAVFLLILFLTQSNAPKKALVYYENKLVLTIDLAKAERNKYEVNGALGKVIIESQNGKVRVIDENSPNHICSKQGYIEQSYQVLVCLPNKVVIKIEEQTEIDTVVK